MSFLQLARLSQKNIIRHGILSAIFVSVISIILSIIFILLSAICGVENNILTAFLNPTAQKVVTMVDICDGSYDINSSDMICDTPEKYDSIASQHAKEYGGNSLGALIVYKNTAGEYLNVISEKAAKYLKTDPLYNVPKNKIPIVIASDYDSSKISSDFYVLGNYSSSNKAIISDEQNHSFLDSFIRTGNSAKDFYVIMDETSKVAQYLYLNGYSALYYYPVVCLDDFDSAYLYYKNEDCDIEYCES